MQSLYQDIIARLIAFGRTYHGWLAAALLVGMFGLSLGAMLGDSAIVDEVAHIPAAYSYLHYGDMRLNPEHPPLIKDLSGLPLQFMDVKFPTELPAWKDEANGQWEAGWHFLYHIGNDAYQILNWSRLPVLLIAVAFGVILYRFVQRRWGWAAGLLALLFYALSPNFLAHSHYVTTDLGASAFTFLALVAFVRFVERPTRNQIILLSVALAAANLAKFNAALLFPLLGAVTLAVVWATEEPRQWLKRAQTYVGGYLLACIGSLAWIWLYYVPHVLNMPAAVQDRLITGSLTSGPMIVVGNFLKSVNDISIFKPLTQYLLGVAMVYGRVSGGNVTYFNGEVRDGSFLGYFPELFVLKTQVAFLILLLMAVAVLVAWMVRRRGLGVVKLLKGSVRDHLLEWTFGLFAVFYFTISVVGNLNLGIRHILPIYVPLFVLVALAIVRLWRSWRKNKIRPWATSALAALLVWYVASAALVYPSFTAYFNELVGGPANADKVFTDSSVDWGQDLYRFKDYLDKHPEIDKIALDYFGGGEPSYVFCKRSYDASGQLIADASGYDCSESRVVTWHSQNGPYTGQYMAVSETFLMNDVHYSGLRNERGYKDLRAMQPIAKIGYSIYVYKLY